MTNADRLRIIDSWGYKISSKTLMSGQVRMSWHWFGSEVAQGDIFENYDVAVWNVYNIINDKIWFMAGFHTEPPIYYDNC